MIMMMIMIMIITKIMTIIMIIIMIMITRQSITREHYTHIAGSYPINLVRH